MTLELPPGLPPMVIECVAGHFPRGDETAMRAVADRWSDTAEEWRATAAYHDDQAGKVVTAARGKGGGSAEQNHRDLAERCRAQAECHDSLAEQLYENANNTELQKCTVGGFALLLAWQLLRAAIMFSPAGATVEWHLQRMATETALQIVRRKTLIFLAGQSAKFAAERSTLRLAGNAAFWGGVQLGGLNLAVQGHQMLEDHRDSVDWNGSLIATASGAAGGFAGAVAGKSIGERWIIPRTVALAEGARSTAGRVLYQVGGTALVGTIGGLAGGIVGAVASLRLAGQEITAEAIGETLIPAMAGGFLGAAAHGAADIRSATRPVTPHGAASPGAGRAVNALAAGTLAVSALTGGLHSDAPVNALGGAGRNARSVTDAPDAPVAEHGARTRDPNAPIHRQPDHLSTRPDRPADPISRPAPFARAEYNIGIWKPKDPNNLFPDGVNQARADLITHPAGEQLPANKAPRIQTVYTAADQGRPSYTDVNILGAAHPAEPAAVGAAPRSLAEVDIGGARPDIETPAAPMLPRSELEQTGLATADHRTGAAETGRGTGHTSRPADPVAPADAVHSGEFPAPAPHPTAGQPADAPPVHPADREPNTARPGTDERLAAAPAAGPVRAPDITAATPHPVEPAATGGPRPHPTESTQPLPIPATPTGAPGNTAHAPGPTGRPAEAGPAGARPDPAGSPQRGQERRATTEAGPAQPTGPRAAVSADIGTPPPDLAAAAAHNQSATSGVAHSLGPEKAGWVARPAEWTPNHSGQTPVFPTADALISKASETVGAAKPGDETGGVQQPRAAEAESATDPDPDTTVNRAGRTETEEPTTRLDEAGRTPAEDHARAADRVRQDAEETLRDYAARSGPGIPETQRLVNASNETLVEMLRGNPADATAALIEVIRRGEDKVLRWTQVAALTAMHESVVNMDAGEGKSLVFVAHAARDAMAHGAVQVITTRDTLANREFIRFTEVLGPLGFDIVRMNPDTAPAAPTPGKPTIYIGTQQDVGFAALRENWVPGRHATIDEIDEALVHADTMYALSDGAGRPADIEVAAVVGAAHDILDKGILTASDFGLARERHGGPANLTESARRTLEHQLGRTLRDGETNRLNMAAAAKWEYVENVHYVRHEIDGQERIFIIDQTTHKVMFDPETATESRWNGGLAQAIEAKHDLLVRADPKHSRTITAQQLFGPEHYDRVTGASGTARGSAKQLADLLGTDVTTVGRFHDSKLEVLVDAISADEAVKLQTLATDIEQMQKTGRPQLVLADRNDIVARLSDLLRPGDVEHIAVDAKWFLEQGTRAETELQRIFDGAGQEGKVLVINMQGARGVDIPITAVTRELGGLHVAVTGRSALSHDIDIQAQNRAARNGDPGSVRYYTSPTDNLYTLTDNPLVQQVVVKYVGEYSQATAEHRAAPSVETRMRLSRAESDLRGLVHPLQQEAAARHRQDAAPAEHNSGPATRAPPVEQPDDETTRHSPTTNHLPQAGPGLVPSAATAGQPDLLAGKVGKWAADDAGTLLRQAQDGRPGAAQALQQRLGSTTLQHVLTTTLGWDPAQGAPTAPVQQLAHAINSAGFHTAQRDGWQVPQNRDLGGWLGEQLRNVMGEALGQLEQHQLAHFAAARNALRQGDELTAPQLAAIDELTVAVRARVPGDAPAARTGFDDAAAAVTRIPSLVSPDSPADRAATPIHPDRTGRPDAHAVLPDGRLRAATPAASETETNSSTTWFGLDFTAAPAGGLLLPEGTPRNSRNQQPVQPRRRPGTATNGAGTLDPAADTPWSRRRTRSAAGTVQPATASFGRIDAAGTRVSSPRRTESPPSVPTTRPGPATPSHRAAAAPAAGLVVALARGTIAEQLPPIVRNALENDPRALQDALERLTPRQRQVLHHRFLLEQSPAETAEALGRSADAIRTTQHAAFLRLAELLNRQVHDETPVTPRDTRSTVTDIPEHVRACLVQTVRATYALGYDGATLPAEGADTWKDLEDSLGAFTRVPGSQTTDIVARVLDKVADPGNDIDTVDIVVDYGTNAHSYTVTTIGDQTVVFDTDIAHPATRTGTRTDPRRIARVRTRENWEPADSARIKSAFVLEFTQDSAGRLQPVRPDRVDGPDAAQRQHKIQGPPAEVPEGPGLPEPSRSFLQWIRSKFRPANRNLFLRFLGGTGASVLGAAWVSGAQLTMDSLGASTTMLGVMAALTNAGAVLGKLVSGPIADKRDNRKTLKILSTAAIATMLFSGGWIATGWAGAVIALLAAGGIMSVIDAVAGAVSRNYAQGLARTLAEEKIATDYYLLERSLASALGRALGPILQPIASALLFGLLGSAHLLHLAILRMLPTVAPPNEGDPPGFFDGARALWRDSYMRGFLGLSLPAVFANTVAGVHLVKIVTSDVNDYSSIVQALLMSAVSTGIVGSKLIPEKWIERGHVNWTYPASLLSLAGLMVAYATSTNPVVLWSAAAFSGVVNMVQNKAFNAEVNRVVPKDRRGGAWSAIDVIGALGGVAGGLSAGVILHLGGWTAGWLNAGILSAAAIGAAVLGFATRNRKNPPPPVGDGSAEHEPPVSIAPVVLPEDELGLTIAALGGDNTPDAALHQQLRPHPIRGDGGLDAIIRDLRTPGNGIDLVVVALRKGDDTKSYVMADADGTLFVVGPHEEPGRPQVRKYERDSEWQPPYRDIDRAFAAYWSDNRGELTHRLPPSPAVPFALPLAGAKPAEPEHSPDPPTPGSPDRGPRPNTSAPNRPEDFLSVTGTRHPGSGEPAAHRPQPWKARQETGMTNTEPARPPAKAAISPDPDPDANPGPAPPAATGARPPDTANTRTAPEQSGNGTHRPPDIEDALDLPRGHRNPPPWAAHPGRGVPDQAMTTQHAPEDDGRESPPRSRGAPLPTPWQ